MTNLVLWSHQSTVDYNYSVNGDMSRIVEWILDDKLFEVPDDLRMMEVTKLLSDIAANGLDEDRKVTLPASAADKADRLRKFLEGKIKGARLSNKTQFSAKPDVQIGGDPAIASIRGHMLRLGPSETDLPDVGYIGLLPTSVDEVLQGEEIPESADVSRALKIKIPIDAKPQSIGLESDTAKIIFILPEGRSIVDLVDDDGSFTSYLAKLEGLLKQQPRERVVLAVNAGQPSMKTAETSALLQSFKTLAEKYRRPEMVDVKKRQVSELLFLKRLLTDVKSTPFGAQVRTMVATRDFGAGERSKLFRAQVLTLLEDADIISMNDSELKALHASANGSVEDIPLAYKLRSLPFRAIKVCHAAEGAIMDLGCRPEHIVNSKQFRKNPAQFLEEVLRFSADGATYSMDATAGLGRSANEAMVRIYSHHIKEEDRQNDRFKAKFLDVTKPLPAGMMSIPAARVVRTLGAVVGVGAVFDGLLVSFLMRR